MSESIQRVYIKVLNYLYRKAIGKIPEKVRNCLILTVFIMFFLYFIVFRSSTYYQYLLKRMTYPQVAGSVLLLIVAVLSVNKELHTIKTRKIINIPYMLFAIGIIVIRMIHPLGAGYLTFGLMLIIIYPCLHLVWNNRRDYETLFDRIAMACMLSGVAYFALSIYKLIKNNGVMEGGRRTGGMYNANFLAFLGVSIACSALYYWYRCFRNEKEHRHIAAAFSILMFVYGVYLTIVGESRSSILIIAGAFLAILFFALKNGIAYVDERKNKRIKRLIFLLLACLILGGIYLISINNNAVMVERFSLRNKTVDEFASGRIGLWRNYAQNLNLLGHDMTSVDWSSLTAGINTRHAHNTCLDFSYRFGVPVGVAFLIFHMTAGIMTLCIMFRKGKNKSWEVFLVICVMYFTVHALIDIATVPMGSYGPFFFYIVIAPLFLEDRDILKKV